MTIQEKISLVWQFRNHKTRTCLELKQIFPLHVIATALLGNDTTVPLIALKTSDFPAPDGEKIPMFHFGEAIQCRVNNGNFRDDDIFRLTEKGEDILYNSEEEMHHEQQHNESMALNKKIYCATLIGIIIGAISVLISLLK